MSGACGVRCRAVAVGLALASGALFGAGLVIAGMTDPARVRAFLDATAWQPTLAAVLVAALAVHAVLARVIAARRRDPWFDVAFHIPRRTDIDRRLVVGAALFGAGWGLAGLCPGAALAAAGALDRSALVFVVAMLAGMSLYQRTTRG